MTYVRVQHADGIFWLAKGTLKTVLEGRLEVLEERPGRGAGRLGLRRPVRRPPGGRGCLREGHSRRSRASPTLHRVVAWTEVGEAEGTGIVHIAPGCGDEDYALGKELGLPLIAPLDESGIVIEGFGALTGSRRARRHRAHRGAPSKGRAASCASRSTATATRTAGAARRLLLFRLVDEWFINMGEVYDQPRETLAPEQVDRSLRDQIMEVVDQIRWLPRSATSASSTGSRTWATG